MQLTYRGVSYQLNSGKAQAMPISVTGKYRGVPIKIGTFYDGTLATHDQDTHDNQQHLDPQTLIRQDIANLYQTSLYPSLSHFSLLIPAYKQC